MILWALLFFMYSQLLVASAHQIFAHNDPLVAFSFSNVPFVAKNGTTDSLVSFHHYEKAVDITTTATLDGQPNQPNPLLNASISLLEIVQEFPFLVTKQEPTVLYGIQAFGDASNPMVIATARDIMDAGTGIDDAHKAGDIRSFTFGATGTSFDRQHDFFFLAVDGHDAPFGAVGSGVALLEYGAEVATYEQKNEKTGEIEKKEYVKKRFFKQLDAVGTSTTLLRAYPIDNRDSESNPINIAGGLASVESGVSAMYWDQQLQRLYIGLSVSTRDDSASHQGACAVLVGRVEENKLLVEPIIGHEFLVGQEQSIVSVCKPSARCTIRSISTIHMNTGVRYLMMVKENHQGNHDAVYVVPLVDSTHSAPLQDWVHDPSVGTIAAVDRDPVCTGSYGVAYTQPISSYQQVPSFSDKRFKVGGDSVLPGKIVECRPVGDAVYVSISAPDKILDGFYCSLPIFNNKKQIVGWTSWQRVLAMRGTPIRFCFNSADRVLCSIEQDDQQNVIFHKTGWERIAADVPTVEALPKFFYQLVDFFKSVDGGMQAIAQLRLSRNNTNDAMPTGLYLAAGYQKVVLINYSTQNQWGISLFENDPTIHKLGAIGCAAAHVQGDNVWLLISGPRGTAFLADEDGLPPTQDIVADAVYNTALLSRYKWKLIDDQSARKIYYQDNALWFVQDKVIIKRLLNNTTIGEKETIFDVSIVGTSARVTELIIGKKMLLVGTTKGLFKKLDYTTDENKWEVVSLEQPGAVISCFKIAQDQRLFDEDGQLYVMSGSSLEGRAFICRFFVTNGDLKLVPYDSERAILINCKGYRASLFVEGSHFLMTKNITRGQAPALQWYQLLPPGYILSYRYTNNTYIPVQIPFCTRMDHIVYDSIIGCLMVCGDGGMYIRA